nr:gamma thionin [Tanacetum cinerariifolium]
MGKALFAFLLVLVVFASVETGVKVSEAKMCRTTGHIGSCVNDWTCSSKCEKDGFASGSCDGFRRRCIF